MKGYFSRFLKHKKESASCVDPKTGEKVCPLSVLGEDNTGDVYRTLTSKKAMIDEIKCRQISALGKTALLKLKPKDLVDMLITDDKGKEAGGGENLMEEIHDMEMGVLHGQLGDLEVDEDDGIKGVEESTPTEEDDENEDDLPIELLEELCEGHGE